ncbi:MAG: hypothetical protein M1818_003107 [Claussenomyces sp. TS43310]|nr:MAG: hypothetical protein M1818_003107 [Claussenomyces sp. TS43310]
MGTSITPDEIKRFEITEVYAHPEAKVDIVLVHGLNGHPRMTWTAKNGVFWPTDLLPLTLKKAKARVLVYGYNADVYAFGSDKGASSDMIHQHAQTLVNSLALERKSEEMDENAIIWVAHSLGGILVKRALEYSNGLTSKSSDPSRSIFVSTYGIIFLGTPHTGSDHAKMGTILQSICNTVIPKSILHTEPHLVRTLLSDNETLQNINVHFLDIFQRFQIDFVHEAAKTELVKGMKDFVVDQASASMQLPGVRYYGIEANHSNMCKFESKNAPGYLNVSMTIKTWVSEAPPIIESRLVLERDARRQAKVNEANETLGIYAANPMSQSSSSVGGLPGMSTVKASAQPHLHSVQRTGRIEGAPQSSRAFDFATADIMDMDEEVAER